MDLAFSKDDLAFRDEVRRFIAENYPAQLHDKRLSEDAFEKDDYLAWHRILAKQGWVAPGWPKEYGGPGWTPTQKYIWSEEQARADTIPILPFGINMVSPVIYTFGTPEQKAKFLPATLNGDIWWCQGYSEPGAGSDLASLRTRAVRDGDHFVVNGQKIWTSLGHRAKWCQLYVRTDPEAPKHKGISCLILDMSLPGIEVRPLVTLSGDADFAEVFFNDVRVPADALLGPENGGWQIATTTLSHERAGAARLYTEMQVRLAELVTDLADVQIGNRRVVEDPTTLRRLGEIALRIKYLEVLCQRSISAILHGGDAFGSASLAKTIWGEVGQSIAALAFDLLGTHPDGRRWADYRLTSRSLTIAGGTTQINKNITAQRVLGLPRS